MTELIPLHVHSNYSLLDSMIKIKDYVKWGVYCCFNVDYNIYRSNPT